MLRCVSSYIFNRKAVQSRGMEVNPRKSKSRWSAPAVFPVLLHDLV